MFYSSRFACSQFFNTFFSTLATVYFLNIVDGKPRVMPSQESIVWTLTTQVAGAASAVLFYSGIQSASVPFILAGAADHWSGSPACTGSMKSDLTRSSR